MSLACQGRELKSPPSGLQSEGPVLAGSHGPVEIVSFPIENGDFPSQSVNVYQRVYGTPSSRIRTVQKVGTIYVEST